MEERFIEMKGQPIRELERELALNYNLEQVVADLVDNSIDAGANTDMRISVFAPRLAFLIYHQIRQQPSRRHQHHILG